MAIESAFPRARIIPSEDVIGRQGFLNQLVDRLYFVDRIGGTALLNALRTVFQQQENTVYLFLGSEPSMMKTIFADR